MPLTPSFGDKIAAKIVALYAAGEEQLYRFLAKSLQGERGTGANWAARMIIKVGPVRVGVQRILDRLHGESRVMVTEAIRQAWENGRNAALEDIPGERVPVFNVDGASARAAEELNQRLVETRPRAAESASNIYRQVIDEVTRDESITSEASRKRLVQRALDRFARDGITSFIDQRGRNYDLVSYTEMAVRAAVSEGEINAYMQQLVAAGIDLVVISDVPQSCALCEPFESKLVSITGATRAAIWVDPETGRTRSVPVFSTLAEARAAGLWHPGCRHVAKGWTPDSPFPPPADPPDPEGYKATQRLRALERRVRREKRVLAAAMSPEAETAARRRIRGVQAQIRDHIARTGVQRRRDREQLHRGYESTPDARALNAEKRTQQRKTVDELVEEIRSERGQ
ncbi:phage minor capsid protein [Rhodococcus ruber]|uniref:Putative phage protein n=1 Tax=Rhodococcus ruber TaxID=1830 RepID=A0A098BJW1_9NOCA